MIISQERLDEIQTIKNEIGWSWDTVASRLGWSPHQMRQVRGLKIPVADDHITWLIAVKAAIDAVPVPGPEVFMPQPPITQDVKVMLLEDIAEKLVDEYFSLDGQGGSPEEIAGARYMVGRLAERCGVAQEVREAIRERQAQSVLTPPERRFPLPPLRVEGTTVTQAQYYGDPEAPPTQPPPRIGNPFLRERVRVPIED